MKLIVIAVTSLGAVATAIARFGVVAATDDQQSRTDAASPHDFVQDPPGVPALAQRGAPRSAPVSFGTFTSVQVNTDAHGANLPGDAANEPTITYDRNDPRRVAIGWRQFDTTASNFREAGWAFSRDAGRTWTNGGVLQNGVFRTDPVLESDASGTFFYQSESQPGGGYACDVFRSYDGGATWSAPVYAFGGDKAWLGIDVTGGLGAGNLYQAWNVSAGCCGGNTFNRSCDGGATYSTPIPIPLTPVFGTVDVASDGTVFVAGVAPFNYNNFYVSRSADGQNCSVTPTLTTTPVSLGGSLQYFIGGPNPGGLLGQAWVACDRSSGPTAGNVYLLCSVDPPGTDPLDVRFSRSTDGGSTWSPSVRVNDDPQTPNAWQWFGTMSVAPDGRIDVVWNDTRASQAASISQLYYSSSTDGGVTWSANQQLSASWNSLLGFPNQNKIGDYYDMTSDLVGANLAWAATFNGEQDVYFMRIGDYDCNGNGIGDGVDISSGSSADVDANGVPDECQCDAINYCVGAPNSVGPGARIAHTGTLGIADNTFTVLVSGCPPNKFGLFFYGPTQLAAPFGNGFLCVGSGSTGVFRLSPPIATNALGNAARLVDFTVPPAGSGPGQILPLSEWNFQFWYRDPAGGGSGFNLSDALSAVFCP